MIGYILIFTAIAVAAAIAFELFNGSDHKVVPVAITALIVGLLVNWVAIYLINLPFSHVMTGGYIILFFTNLALATGISAAYGMFRYNEIFNGMTAGVITLIITAIIAGVISSATTPGLCDTNGLRAQIALLDLQPAPEGMTFHPTSLDQLIKVPASAALTKAGNELSGGENVALGNYLQPAVPYLTHVQGVPTYVVDLKVTNAMGYRNAAANGESPAIPGYALVNAIDGSTKPELRLGYKIVYAPEALFSYDLDRKVYFDYLLPQNKLVSDLNGMEIDDNFVPSYTGTVMGHPLSYKTTQPIGIYQLDPTTGEGRFVSLSDVPVELPHLDRVYPLNWVLDQVVLWGRFNNHESCNPWNSNGQVQIDSSNEVITPNGIEYQISMTGMGDDPSMTQLITVDAKTGKGFIFPLTGKSIESIQDQFKGLTKKLRVDGLKVDECELHALGTDSDIPTNTAYCIFTNSDQYGNTNIGGYGFVALDNADDDADYALSDTFDGAYNEYLKIRSSVAGNTVIANTANDITITGVVASNEWVSDAETGSRLINVVTEDQSSYWILANGSSKNAAAAVIGKTITVTAYQREGQEFLTARYITVKGAPDFGGTLKWNGAIEWFESLFK